MLKTRLVFLLSVLTLSSLMVLSAAGVASAQTRPTWTADLTGAQEVPPQGVEATATATFVRYPDSIKFTLVVNNPFATPITMAHIHAGPVGVNGPVVVNLCGAGGAPACGQTGTIAHGRITHRSLVGPLAGKTLADLEALFNSGGAYVNIHTVAHPGGAIRGQVMPGTSSSSAAIADTDEGSSADVDDMDADQAQMTHSDARVDHDQALDNADARADARADRADARADRDQALDNADARADRAADAVMDRGEAAPADQDGADR